MAVLDKSVLPRAGRRRFDWEVPDSPIRLGLDYRPAILTSAGIGRSVRELSRAVAELPDVDLHLFGHSFARSRRRDPVPSGGRLHRLPIPGRSLPLLARFGLDASRLSGRVPLFHWTDYVHPPVTAARVILTLHDLAFAADPTFHGPTTGLLTERCGAAVARAEHIICPTRATADEAQELFGRDRNSITVIPWGCDHVPHSPGPAPITQPYLLTVGTIEPRKNHQLLLDSWRALSAPRPRLVVLGRRGWECDEIVADLLRAVRGEGALWIEDVDDATVFSFMANALALVYPSRLEGFGFPPMEAMALGTPVIAGDTPALREVLGDTARLCDPNDGEALTAQLQAVIDDEGSRGQQIAAGRARASEFTWRACAEAHARVYREVLS
jgi:glycosyltransferase involved in cell wall biosynthesis